ncbi:Transcription factor TFIIB cyclin-related protein [Desulfurococcus mucosus DSM 2162]|uniref:Transcription factor TFIIB cyclin-related protein n=1 Tax=Desulfurococcus mucosus (strain ATCC 35584 / DSM 2162 / JCM 9187 / O7/1) TaxID=765177 RepID=E8R890_DESM0|nr:Transcription factor TFIIB cyclin-related protein [Desulfurococcus mucosus DSM 2162]
MVEGFNEVLLELATAVSVKTGVPVERLASTASRLLSDPVFTELTKYFDKRFKAAAAVYAALRSMGVCVSPRCVEEYAGVSRTRFTEVLRSMGVEPCSLAGYVSYASRVLGLDDSTAADALWAARRVRVAMGGLSNSTVAAASLYLAARGRLTQKTVSSILCVSEVSVRNIARRMEGLLGDALSFSLREADAPGRPRGSLMLELLGGGGVAAGLTLLEPGVEPWRSVTASAGLPLEGSIVLAEATGRLEHMGIAVGRALSYLCLKGYRVVWTHLSNLAPVLVGEGFKPVSYSPRLGSTIYAVSLSML